MSKEAVSLPVNYEDLSITNDFLKVINTRFQVYLGGLGIFMPQRLRYCSQCSTRSEHIPCQCASEGMHAVMLSGLFGYAGFEKGGPLPRALPQNNTPMDTDAGDIILYQGRQFVIYYDKNSWSLTPLGKITGLDGASLRALLGEGDVTVTLALS